MSTNKQRYIKIVKGFYDAKDDSWDRYSFYILEDIFEQRCQKGGVCGGPLLSHFKLMAVSDIVIKNNELIKYRYDLEEHFDKILL